MSRNIYENRALAPVAAAARRPTRQTVERFDQERSR